MPPKKDKPAGWNFDPIEGIIVIIFFMAILASIISAISNYITSGELTFYGIKISDIIEFFKSSAWFWRTLGYVLAGAAVVGTFIFNKKADAIWREMKAKLYPDTKDLGVGVNPEKEEAEIPPPASSPPPKPIPPKPIPAEPVRNPLTESWKIIIQLSESENSSDWRMAIIQADIILDDLLMKLQLPGSTIGEKLQAVEKSDFTTIECAWEAHKARNNIAHKGGNYLLNQRETRRILSLYGAVFREFRMI